MTVVPVLNILGLTRNFILDYDHFLSEVSVSLSDHFVEGNKYTGCNSGCSFAHDAMQTPRISQISTMILLQDRNFRPPGPFLQKVNSLVHQEPLDSILYAVYWSVIIALFSPIAIFLLQLRLFFHLCKSSLGILRKTSGCDPKTHPTQELAVVITGCDTGFGREVAFQAATAGYVVFAGCLRDESVTELERLSKNIQAFTMDVTVDEDVEKAVLLLSKWLKAGKEKQRILHALVNMAGIGHCGNVDFMPLALFQKSMDGECSWQLIVNI